MIDAADGIEQNRFAGAVGANDGENFPFPAI